MLFRLNNFKIKKRFFFKMLCLDLCYSSFNIKNIREFFFFVKFLEILTLKKSLIISLKISDNYMIANNVLHFNASKTIMAKRVDSVKQVFNKRLRVSFSSTKTFDFFINNFFVVYFLHFFSKIKYIKSFQVFKLQKSKIFFNYNFISVCFFSKSRYNLLSFYKLYDITNYALFFSFIFFIPCCNNFFFNLFMSSLFLLNVVFL